MRHYLITVIVPLIMVALSIPMIAGWIGRNYFYGFRTPRTLSSDTVWYPANRVAGLLMLCAGLVWLAAGVAAGPMAGLGTGLVALTLAFAGSFIYLSRRPKTD